jgi:2-isopropylmalate synthase
MLKHQATYEIMRPESVGLTQTQLVLGKHSGRAAIAARLTELGYAFDDEALARIFTRFKALADRRKSVGDADLEALLHDDAKPQDERFALEGLQVACGTQGMATATVRLRGPDGRVRVHASVGTGPVDAAYKAIDELIDAPAELLEFSVRSVTEGIDALGEVTVRVKGIGLSERDTKNAQHDVQTTPVFHGNAADTDILVAAAKAYIKALNRLLAALGQPGREAGSPGFEPRTSEEQSDRAAPLAPAPPAQEGRP